MYLVKNLIMLHLQYQLLSLKLEAFDISYNLSEIFVLIAMGI